MFRGIGTWAFGNTHGVVSTVFIVSRRALGGAIGIKVGYQKQLVQNVGTIARN